jgi:hypothetical protein
MNCFVVVQNHLYQLYPITEHTLIHDILYTLLHARGQITECYLEDEYGSRLEEEKTLVSYGLVDKKLYYKCVFPRNPIQFYKPFTMLQIKMYSLQHTRINTILLCKYSETDVNKIIKFSKKMGYEVSKFTDHEFISYFTV